MSQEKCEKEGVPPPTVAEKDGYVRLTFARTTQLSQDSVRPNLESSTEIREVGKNTGQEDVGKKRAGKVGQKCEKVGQKAGETIEVALPSLRKDIRGNVIKVLTAIGDDSHVTIREIARHVGISATTVKASLSLLKEVGILYRVGGDRGGHWLISWKGGR